MCIMYLLLYWSIVFNMNNSIYSKNPNVNSFLNYYYAYYYDFYYQSGKEKGTYFYTIYT